MDSKPEDILNDLLEEAKSEKTARKSLLSEHPELAQQVELFMELKGNNDERVVGLTLAWFWREKLQPKFGGPKSVETIKSYVKDVMKLDYKTGKPFEDEN